MNWLRRSDRQRSSPGRQSENVPLQQIHNVGGFHVLSSAAIGGREGHHAGPVLFCVARWGLAIGILCADTEKHSTFH
jgi:hypothetical protein